MNPRSLQAQIAAIRDLLSSAKNDDVRACAEAAIKPLEWISKGEDVLKELVRLRKEEPELFKALSDLIGMGARVNAIRERNAA